MRKRGKIKLTVGALAILSVLGISNCFAETSTKTNVSVEVKQGCNVTATNNEHTGTISNGTYSEIGDPTEFTIACNGNNKYDIYAVGYTGDTEGNNKLVGDKDNDNKYDIITGTAQSGEASNWAFKLSEPSEGLTLESTYSSNFTSIPGQSEKVASRTASTLNNTKDTFKSTYAAYISKSQPADTYHGKVKYTLMDQGTTPITNYSITYDINGGDSSSLPSPNPQTGSTVDATIALSDKTPIRDGYTFLGWCTDNLGSNTACSGNTYQPGKPYNLSDGASIKLYAMWKSNAPSTMQDFGNYCDKMNQDQTLKLKDTRDNTEYTIAKLKDNKCWMTQNLRLGKSTTMNLSPSDTDIVSSYTLPASSTSGSSSDSAQNIYVTPTPDNNHYGGYYSYATATAGTNPSSGEASHSICPRGWRLPTNVEFNALISNYSITTIQQSPANFVLAGEYDYYNSLLIGQGETGYWRSSTTDGSSAAYFLYLNPSASGFITISSIRWLACSIRCMSRQ